MLSGSSGYQLRKVAGTTRLHVSLRVAEHAYRPSMPVFDARGCLYSIIGALTVVCRHGQVTNVDGLRASERYGPVAHGARWLGGNLS